MPIYQYKCDCGKKFDRYLPVSQYNKPQSCDCGKRAEKYFTASHYVMPDLDAYKSPIDGSYIGSRSKHRVHMKKHGVIEAGNEKLNRSWRKEYKPEGVVDDIKRSIYEVSQR